MLGARLQPPGPADSHPPVGTGQEAAVRVSAKPLLAAGLGGCPGSGAPGSAPAADAHPGGSPGLGRWRWARGRRGARRSRGAPAGDSAARAASASSPANGLPGRVDEAKQAVGRGAPNGPFGACVWKARGRHGAGRRQCGWDAGGAPCGGFRGRGAVPALWSRGQGGCPWDPADRAFGRD